jgi:hypothetical protein
VAAFKKLSFAVAILVGCFTPSVIAEPYNFQGRNFCLAEDTRMMTAEGVPTAHPVANAPKSFRFTFGPVKDREIYAAEVEGSDLPILDGMYYSTEDLRGRMVKEQNVGFAWALMLTGELNFILSSFAQDGTTPVWVVVTAQCYKSE